MCQTTFQELDFPGSYVDSFSFGVRGVVRGVFGGEEMRALKTCRSDWQAAYHPKYSVTHIGENAFDLAHRIT